MEFKIKCVIFIALCFGKAVDGIGECAVGFGVKRLATPTSDTVCEQCTDGVTFSNISSASSPCKLCTACPNGNTPYVPCNTQADAICERVLKKEFKLTTANIIEIVFGVIGFLVLICMVIFRKRVTRMLLKCCRSKESGKCTYTSVEQAGTGVSSRDDDDDDSDDTSINSRRQVTLFSRYGRPIRLNEAGTQAAVHGPNATNQPNATNGPNQPNATEKKLTQPNATANGHTQPNATANGPNKPNAANGHNQPNATANGPNKPNATARLADPSDAYNGRELP